MVADTTSQLMGALGAWLEAKPNGSTAATRDLATNLILGGALLGVATRDVTSPALANLSEPEQELLDDVRAWAYPDEDLARVGTTAPHVSLPVESATEVDSQPQHVATFAALTLGVDEPSETVQSPELATVESESAGAPTGDTSPCRVPSTTAFADATSTASDVSTESGSEAEQAEPDDIEADVGHEPHARRTSTRPAWLNEELVWWIVCAVAVAILIARRLF